MAAIAIGWVTSNGELASVPWSSGLGRLRLSVHVEQLYSQALRRR
jgi:hypothetical protein